MIQVCIIVFLSMVAAIFCVLKNLQIIQLNSYNLDQQLIWYKKNVAKWGANVVLLVVLILYLYTASNMLLFFSVVYMVLIIFINSPRNQKKKLVFTQRIIRNVVLIAIVSILFFIPTIIYFVNDKITNSSAEACAILFPMILVALMPFIVFIVYLVLLPVENFLRKKYRLEAKKIVDNSRCFVIGITGSFGKTSVKYYLSTILKEKYNVCMTPESYNTAMGATITIKNNLKSFDEFFVCEMGARRIGDIKEICDMVTPMSCIITDIGEMHLDTFHSVENVVKTKFELVDAVVENTKNNEETAIILVNGDNEYIKSKVATYSFSDINKKHFWTYGVSDDCDFRVVSIVQKGDVDCFEVEYKDTNSGKSKVLQFETQLIGKFNVRNLTAAIGYAILLGIDYESIKNAVKKISPVPHRLQILNSDKNNVFIDDAYNSNLNGAKNAVDAVGRFDGYIKVIITPGMVELGDRQDKINEEFAKYAGEIVDYALIVSKTNKEALYKGFTYAMDKEKVLCFDKIEEAIAYARLEVGTVNDKKVILMENDLSDNY